ncbi:TPA: hypothetical protein DCW54_03220, partial [Candidatus Dependentiae bacterium]|nr:hypothetical protein [Candidatus Dependentiae bacterium]
MKKIIVSLLVFVLLGSYKNTLCAEAAAPSQNITAGATRFPCIMEHSKLLASFEPEEFEEASKATTPASSIESDKQSTPLQGILIELTKKIDGRPFTENQSLQILTILEILLELFVTKQTDDLKGILHEITNLLETDINKSKISLTDLIYTAEMLQLPKEFMWLLTDPISTKFFQSPLPPDASQAHIKNITRFFGDTGTEEKKNVLKWLLAWMTGQKADTPETTISHPLKSRLISTLENSDFSSKITLSPDKTKFFSATKNNTVSVWDLEQGKFLYQLSHTGLINSTLFSPDSKKIITASNDGNAKIWDSATGAILKTLPHPIAISFATLSFDEKLALTLDIHKVVRVWDVENQINLYALQSADEMEFAQFNPEATKILTRSRSGNAKLWDVTTGTGQSYFEFPHAEVNYARFNADGTKIITCS